MSQPKRIRPNDTPPEGTEYTSPSAAKEFGDAAMKVVKVLASLQLTVVLFVLSLILVFYGTMAQMNQGIWTVVDKYFRSGIVWIPFDLNARFLETFFNLNPDTKWQGSFPFPGGWLLGSVMLVNLLAAHTVRFRMTWKRSGIFIIHAGMILLMVGELVTGMYAVESTMTLQVDESSNFVDQSLTVELVLRSPRDEETDEVIKIPASRLKHKGLIKDDNLPVDIEILEYWKNSEIDIRQGPAPDSSWAVCANAPFVFNVHERPEEAGVDKDQHGDATTIKVNVRKKGTDESLGQFRLSLWYYPNSLMNTRRYIIVPFTFNAGGKEYSIELRNKRDYLPYSLLLKKVEHSNYENTEIPKDFASTLDVIDKEEGDNRECRIWMNNPLRYRGMSFYQYQMTAGVGKTVLQAVRNPGRLLPYLACSMVAAGMMLHFGLNLNVFLRRKKIREAKRAETLPSGTIYERFFPLAVVVLCAAWAASKAIVPSPKPDQIDYYDAGQIPVMQNGRMKPIDTLARTYLQAISGRSEVQNEKKNVTASAVQWYIDVFDSQDKLTSKAAEHKVFRIDNDQVLSLLKLQPRPEFFRYSWKEIEPRYFEFRAEAMKVARKGKKKLDLRDDKIKDLAKKLELYQQLSSGHAPFLIPPQQEGEEWQAMESIDRQIRYTTSERFTAFQTALRKELEQYPDEEEAPKIDVDYTPRLVMMVVDQVLRGDEENDAQSLKPLESRLAIGTLRALRDQAPPLRERVSPVAAKITHLFDLAKNKQVSEFKDALASYRSESLGRLSDSQKRDLKVEAFFNHFAPFYLCSNLYIMVIVLACIGWLVWRQPLNQAAFWLAVFTFGLHTAALLTRMYLQGRPPVTNLYSSAIFICWGCVLLCLGLEYIYRNGIGNVLAGTMGALTMMMAHYLGEGGDTMEMLQAVLDTNFWLATHVTVVTLGYVATFVAGGIAVIFVGQGLFTKSVDAEVSKTFGSMIYGVICFATLLSFTGTILGGIWADYSWGRFWGWDAKENGAVMVVIWNTLILHARWSGLVKLRGVAVLALVGNMITFWSWFGTNQLSAGLHNYGFNSELAERCRYFWIFHAGLIAIALLPLSYWRSFSEDTLAERAAETKARQRALKEQGIDENVRG